MSKHLRWPLRLVVGFLSIVGVGAAVGHYFYEPYNPGFRAFPLITALHVILGGMYLALAPFQFIARIRSRWLSYHRWAGRLLIAIGMIVGAAGLFMAWVIPFSGWSERVILGFFGLLFLVALGKGYLHIRAGRISLHREWMTRAFAIGLAIATMRLIFTPALFMLGARPQQAQILSITSFTLAFTLHALVAEIWIRRSRRKSTQAAHGRVSRWNPL